ncbi:MAG: HAMP domain-containing histidine kinase [Clostridia bacterium]|nr:HAMP domain-containing histidine kinase [Clostridia bacterium]
MRQNIFKRYIFLTCFVVLLCFAAVSVLLTIFYNNYLATEKYKTLSAATDKVSVYLEKSANTTDPFYSGNGLAYTMDSLSSVSETNIFLTDNEGVIKACSCSEKKVTGRCNHLGMTIKKEYLNIALYGKKRLSNLGIYKSVHYVKAKEIKINDSSIYVFATASSMGTKLLIKKVARMYLISAVTPVIVMFSLLYALTVRYTKPLKMMSEAARAMSKGDFSRRIPVKTDDEIGELAASFNEMTDSLARLEETRKDFVANVSHELRTPMTTIGGFIDGIIDGTIPKEKEKEYLELVRDEVKRLSRMVESMLNISRLESKEFVLKYEKFDFKEMLLSIVISQERRIEERGYNIEGLNDIPQIIINADRDLIYRAVYNLVDNAVKFTNSGGTISFALSFDKKNMEFVIKNTGEGIEKKDLPYVFERFYKADKSRSAVKNSTGLGLYIVKTIIEKHGGKISVSSSEENTSFKITLPLI